MSEIPARPNAYPDQWVMVFYYFDKSTTNSALSRPKPYDSEAEARAAAEGAQRAHGGGGIGVMRAFAYPPVDSGEVAPFVVAFA